MKNKKLLLIMLLTGCFGNNNSKKEADDSKRKNEALNDQKKDRTVENLKNIEAYYESQLREILELKLLIENSEKAAEAAAIQDLKTIEEAKNRYENHIKEIKEKKLELKSLEEAEKLVETDLKASSNIKNRYILGQEIAKKEEEERQRRIAEEDEAKRKSQEERIANQERADKAAEEERERRIAEENEAKRKAHEESEKERVANQERADKAAEEERERRIAEEDEAKRKAHEESEKERIANQERADKAAEEERERRIAKEDEAKRKAHEESEKERIANQERADKAAEEERERRIVEENSKEDTNLRQLLASSLKILEIDSKNLEVKVEDIMSEKIKGIVISENLNLAQVKIELLPNEIDIKTKKINGKNPNQKNLEIYEAVIGNVKVYEITLNSEACKQEQAPLPSNLTLNIAGKEREFSILRYKASNLENLKKNLAKNNNESYLIIE